MITIGMTYLVAAMVASGIFVVAGRRSKQVRGLSLVQRSGICPSDALWPEPELDLSTSRPEADVGASLRLALKRLTPVLRNHSVQAEIAAPFGLLVRLRSSALTDLLEDLLGAAIQSAPASRLLLTATKQGDGIYVGVTDDTPCADFTVRMESVRSLKQRVAMRGGALHVDVRPNEGATLTLRLPAVVEQDQPRRVLPEPAKTPSIA